MKNVENYVENFFGLVYKKLGNYKSNNIKTQLNTVFLSKILKFYSKNAGEK